MVLLCSDQDSFRLWLMQWLCQHPGLKQNPEGWAQIVAYLPSRTELRT